MERRKSKKKNFTEKKKKGRVQESMHGCHGKITTCFYLGLFTFSTFGSSVLRGSALAGLGLVGIIQGWVFSRGYGKVPSPPLNSP
ncbi:hypothetical protein BGY98DRAFT_961248, partial [Russula aff. rugulosa BPL654]